MEPAVTLPLILDRNREAAAPAVSNAPIESLEMPAKDLVQHDVLRVLDRLRRRLAWRLRGAE